MLRVGANLIANIVGRFWSVISVALFLPAYLSLLGPEGYGLSSVYSMLQSVILLADFGLSVSAGRELALIAGSPGAAGAPRSILVRYERVAFAVAISVSVAGLIAAPTVTRWWLGPVGISDGEVAVAVRMMVVALALQLVSAVYVGALLGVQRQVVANALQVGWGIFRGVGTVAALKVFGASVPVFAAAQIVASAGHLLSARYVSKRAVASLGQGIGAEGRRHPADLRFIGAMGVVSVLSALMTQLDRVVLGFHETLQVLGAYSIALVVAGAPLLLSMPVTTAMLPKLVQSADRSDEARWRLQVDAASALVGALASSVGMYLLFSRGAVFEVWLGNGGTRVMAEALVVPLLCAQLMQALSLVPFAVAVATGSLRIVVWAQIAMLLIFLPLLLILVPKYGANGAGLAWLACNGVVIPVYSALVMREGESYGRVLDWFMRGVAAPLTAAAASAFALSRLHDVIGAPASLTSIGIGSFGVLLSTVIVTFFAQRPSLRQWTRASVATMRRHR